MAAASSSSSSSSSSSGTRTTTATPVAVVAGPESWDLTDKLIAHVDRHMVLPVLEFLQEHKLYNPADLSRAKFDLVSKTKMVDTASEEWLRLHPEQKTPPKELIALKDVVVAQLVEPKPCQPLLDIITNTDLMSRLNMDKAFTLENLKAKYSISDAQVDNLYVVAKLKFDTGNYHEAADLLGAFRALSSNEEQRFAALWGKLAAEILLVEAETALADLNLLRAAIDNRGGSDLIALQQRTWLIHWSLFIFLHLDNGKSLLIDWLMDPKILNTIQVNCPHVLRYLTAAAIICNKQQRKKNVLKDTVRLLVAEKALYSDPLTEFLTALYVEFDFDLAHKQLKLCRRVLVADFVLHALVDEFLESARALMFETYCRIHKCIDIKTLSAKLEIKDTDTERAILELIKATRVDARIDTERALLIVEKPYPTVYQQVIDKTKSLTWRSQQLQQAIEKKYQNKDTPERA